MPDKDLILEYNTQHLLEFIADAGEFAVLLADEAEGAFADVSGIDA